VARSKTSQRWLKEHFDDPYVKMAQKDGYRSRASYKLLEIQEKDRILHPGMTVVDLGAAPGGWSQVTSRVIGDKGRLIASDILEMDSIPDVTFIQGDFSDDAVFARILEAIGENPVDLVISDMAPNMSGVRTADQARDVSVRAGAGSGRAGFASGRRFPDQDFPGRRFRCVSQAGA
jgi:23S rRNA (uridine2552-2'-O)-methyltransferase